MAGSLSLAQGVAFVPNDLQRFFDNSPYVGVAGNTPWQYRNDLPTVIAEEEQRLKNFTDAQDLQQRVTDTYKVLQYMQALEFGSAFRLTEDEAKLVREALSSNPSEVVMKSVIEAVQEEKDRDCRGQT